MRSKLTSITTAALTVLLFAACPPGPVLANVSNDSPIRQASPESGEVPMVEKTAFSGLQALALGASSMPPLPNPSKQRYLMVDAGGPTTCAIRAGGKGIDCFGFNQLGQADPPKGNFKYLSMGQFHGCALTKVGGLKCWGDATAYPKPEETKKKYKQISAGTDHTCARTVKGELKCWGDNTFGELDVPPGLFLDVSAKGDHTCAIDKTNNLSCWGDNAFTSYGPFTGQYTNVSTGNLHVCALRRSDKRAVCWGNDAFGQASPPPDEFISLTSGNFHTCGQRPDKTMACWGKNQYGQSQPDTRRFAQIGAGGNETCMLIQGSRLLACRGSFAFNDDLFTANTDSMALAQAGFVKPQSSLDSWLSGGLDWFGSSLADGVDTFFSTDLNKWAKAAKFGNIAFGLASFLVSNLLQEEDPNEARFKEILQQLAEIKASLDQISNAMVFLQKEMASANYMIAAQWCDAAIKPLQTIDLAMMDGLSFDGPIQAWRKLMSDYQAYLTRLEQDKKNGLPFNPEAINQLMAKVDNFKGTWMNQDPNKKNLERMRKTLTEMIVGENSTSPLVACKAKSYQAWKSSPNLYPFDDRPIWDQAYKVFIKTMARQDQIADIETGLNAFEMVRVFQGPRLGEDGKSVPPFAWERKEGEQGVCRLAQSAFYTGSSNPRLKDAWEKDGVKGPCQKHPDLIRDIYLGQLKQFEFMGSAYSDDNVVLSMTSTQMGLPRTEANAGQSNWLWFRRADQVNARELRSDFPQEEKTDLNGNKYKVDFSRYRSGSGSPFANYLPLSIDNNRDYRLYLNPTTLDGKEYGEYVWHSNGGAWQDAFQARRDIKESDANEREQYEDFMERLAALKDPVKSCLSGQCETVKIKDKDSGEEIEVRQPGKTGIPAFQGVSKKPFWIIGAGGRADSKAFDLRYKSFALSGYPYAATYGRTALSCFVAEKINDGRKEDGTGMDGESWYHKRTNRDPINGDTFDEASREYLKLSGKVCGDEEFAALLRTNSSLSWQWGIDCRTKEECWGLGAFFPVNKKFDEYKEFFGGTGYRMIYQNAGYNSKWWQWQWYTDETIKKMNLYHLPVVKITGRSCNPRLFADNIERLWLGMQEPSVFTLRTADREVGDGKTRVPSMCGNDLDQVINRYVPRSPYIEMPGIRTLSTQ